MRKASRQRAPQRDLFIGQNRIIDGDKEEVDQKDDGPSQDHVDIFNVKFDSEKLIQSGGNQSQNRIAVHENEQTGEHQQDQQSDSQNSPEAYLEITGDLIAAVQLISIVGDPYEGKLNLGSSPQSTDQKNEIRSAGQSAFKGREKRIDKRVAGELRIQNLRKCPVYSEISQYLRQKSDHGDDGKNKIKAELCRGSVVIWILESRDQSHALVKYFFSNVCHPPLLQDAYRTGAGGGEPPEPSRGGLSYFSPLRKAEHR